MFRNQQCMVTNNIIIIIFTLFVQITNHTYINSKKVVTSGINIKSGDIIICVLLLIVRGRLVYDELQIVLCKDTFLIDGGEGCYHSLPY